MTDEVPRDSVLPPNKSLLETGIDLAAAKVIERIIPPFPELMDPMAAPVDFLPYLAADRGVTEWDSAAPESERRLTTALAWGVKRQAGTRVALENAIRGLELTPEVVAWHERVPRGVPYSFAVRAFSSRPYSEEINARLDRRLAEAKSERDTLSVTVGLRASGMHYIGAATVCGELSVVYPLAIEGLEASGQAFMAAGHYIVETTTIYPEGA